MFKIQQPQSNTEKKDEDLAGLFKIQQSESKTAKKDEEIDRLVLQV